MLHPAGSGRRRAAALGNEVPYAATETTEATAFETTEAATAASRRIVGTLTHSRRAVALIAARIAPHQDLFHAKLCSACVSFRLLPGVDRRSASVVVVALNATATRFFIVIIFVLGDVHGDVARASERVARPSGPSAKWLGFPNARAAMDLLEPIFTQAANTKAIAAGGQTIDPQA